MIHKDLTYQIIGCAMEVHKHIGNGFKEVVYQRALAIEMGLQGVDFHRELEMPLEYKNVGTRRVGFFCGRQNNGINKSSNKPRRYSFSPSHVLR